MKGETLGIAVVGSGRIGTLRARMAAAHPSVRFLAVSDQDPSRAAVLAEKVGADFSSGDNFEVISRPEVDAVIVSTAEPEHTCPVLQALGRGKPVLVEKPIALRLEDADQMLAAAQRTNTELRVGYSLRFMRRYHLSKEQILQGRLGRLLGMTGRQFNTRAQGFAILGRSPHATPVMDALTYMVDMVGWFLEGNPPVEVVARGHGEVLRNAGYDVDDVTWAIVTFADGAVVNLGVSFALPEKFPTTGRTLRLEVLGTDGAMLIDEDHKTIFCTPIKASPTDIFPTMN